MTPDEYNYQILCELRQNMTPAEVWDEMSPALRGLVSKWDKEDEFAQIAALKGEAG